MNLTTTRQVIEDDLPDSYATDVLQPFQEALVQQIGRALHFFYSTATCDRVDRIILAGGAAGIRGIDRLVEEHIGTATVVADPFTRIPLAPEVKSSALRRDTPAMMIAVGLTLRGSIRIPSVESGVVPQGARLKEYH